MATFDNGETGLSIRTKLNAVITKSDNMHFGARSDFVTWAASASPSSGDVVTADGLSYEYDGTTTDISDLSGWKPLAVSPYHWTANTTPGTTDMQSAIVAAVAYCNTNNEPLYWREENHLTTATIPNFHDVNHIGHGSVTRGSDTWYITPKVNEENFLYVDETGVTANDGLTASQPTTIAQAFDRLAAVGFRAQDGFWGIKFSGETHTAGRVSITGWPNFKNKVRIWGQDAAGNYGDASDLTTSPLTVWDGTTSGDSFAVIANQLYFGGNKFFHFQNIHFRDWVDSAVVLYWDVQALFENCPLTNCPDGIDVRGGYVDVTYGDIDSSDIRVSYGGHANIGGLGTGEGFTVTDCGIYISRGSVAYVEGLTFAGSHEWNISVSVNSRARGQGNTFGNFTLCAVYLDHSSTFNEAKSGFSANTYPTLTEDAPALRYNTVGPINIRPGPYLHQYAGEFTPSDAYIEVGAISGHTARETLADASGSSEWVPFRIPGYTLYSPTFDLIVEMGINIPGSHSGGVLELAGQGNSVANHVLATLTIPASAYVAHDYAILRVRNRPGSTGARWVTKFDALGLHQTGTTPTLDNSAIRNNDPTELLFRLYWTANDTSDDTAFFDMRTYINT